MRKLSERIIHYCATGQRSVRNAGKRFRIVLQQKDQAIPDEKKKKLGIGQVYES